MILRIADMLTPDELARVRAILDAADWVDGNETSGPQSALAKQNRQLPEQGDAARGAGEILLDALSRSPLFIAAALPAKVYPPLFNRYGAGEGFGDHIDNAVRHRRGTDFRIRSDLSATLFLSDPDSYDGGELVIGDAPEGKQGGIKLPAGHMLIYPASTVHRVTPVTRGERVASFFWIQSMIRSTEDRALLYDLDQTIQSVAAERGQGDADVVRLTGTYHNLLRRWADV